MPARWKPKSALCETPAWWALDSSSGQRLTCTCTDFGLEIRKARWVKSKRICYAEWQNHTEGRLRSRRASGYADGLVAAIVLLIVPRELPAQGVAQGTPPPAWAKTMKCRGRQIPQL